TLPYFPRNGVVVGYPVRQAIGAVPKEEARRRLDFDVPSGRKVVFVFGGSQGARTINRALVQALGYLEKYRRQLFVVHGVGLGHSDDYDAVEDTEARLRELYSPETIDSFSDFYYRRS
ncbi:MAG: glycosyltransferase, partial [Mariprofundales bacterium]|nr:glycosyltransferase [Mariprofundales bacterium]